MMIGDPQQPLPRVSTSRILQYQPNLEWFARCPEGIHGIDHETRVLIWTQLLSDMVPQEGLTVDASVLGWAAALHDTQRWDDGADRQHGDRAAEWALARHDLLPHGLARERVVYLCQWHVPPDRMAPEMTPELKVFKDADALDRWRIGDLDPSLLRTQAAHRLLAASRALWLATRNLGSVQRAFVTVVRKAAELQILVDDSSA